MCVSSSHHLSHVKGFQQESSGVSMCFFFLIVLQGIEHASRKTDMQILISCVGGFYTLSPLFQRIKTRTGTVFAENRWHVDSTSLHTLKSPCARAQRNVRARSARASLGSKGTESRVRIATKSQAVQVTTRTYLIWTSKQGPIVMSVFRLLSSLGVWVWAKKHFMNIKQKGVSCR